MIKLVIFDWSGTTIDYGCFAPLEAFKKAFEDYRINLSIEEIRKPMGMLKIDHIKELLKLDRVKKDFHDIYHRNYNENDVERIYTLFERYLFDVLEEYTEPISGVVDTIDYLKNKKIRIGSTTGYTSEMMEVVVATSKSKGYEVEYVSTADITGYGRPSPAMIEDNKRFFNIYDNKTIIKIGDTISDIKEGKNAGVITVGVIYGSSELGLFEHEEVSKEQYDRVKNKYLEAGADYVIDSIADLRNLIKRIEVYEDVRT